MSESKIARFQTPHADAGNLCAKQTIVAGKNCRWRVSKRLDRPNPGSSGMARDCATDDT
jgi:hypothetical protein